MAEMSVKQTKEPEVFRSVDEIRRRFLPGTTADEPGPDVDTPSLGVTGALTQEAFQRARANFSGTQTPHR
jgi:hypothetical protein